MQSGSHPLVAYLNPKWQWCSPSFRVNASELVPQAMAYFHGEVPK